MKSVWKIFGILLVAVSCTMTGSNYTTADKKTDFSKYQSFAWLPKDSSQIQNVLYDNGIVARNIREIVNSELVKKGYYINRDTPDVLIQYTLVVENKEEIINNSTVQNTLPGSNPFIQPYNSNATDSPGNLYFYSNAGNAYNYNFYVNNYPYYTNAGFPQPVPYAVHNNFQQINYKEGTLIIDFIDTKTNELVWRGWNTETLTDPNSFQTALPRELENILRKIPGKNRRMR
ncbi:MAG: DUF4136 domain-containing protein [Cytophagaceae bacterium]|nr:DUF4136 domain-containing protein [Cytophagaceae bacterium]